MNVGGKLDSASVRVESAAVRRMVRGRSGHGSSSFNGSCQGLSFWLLPWLNQPRIMNCSQAAASRLRVVAGTNVWRDRSSRLTVLGLGLRMAGSGSGYVSRIGTFRPKRVRALPMVGLDRSLYVPSAA